MFKFKFKFTDVFEMDKPIGSQRADGNNENENNKISNNPQSEICRPGSSSTEFKSGINTRFGDDLKRRDQYKPGVVEG